MMWIMYAAAGHVKRQSSCYEHIDSPSVPARRLRRARLCACLRTRGAPLFASLCLSPSLSLFCLSLSLTPQSYMDSPRATPTGRGGGQPPRPDPEPPHPAARAKRDKNASSVLFDLHRQPRGTPSRAPSGRLPRPATPMTHECLACLECPACPAHDAPPPPSPGGGAGFAAVGPGNSWPRGADNPHMFWRIRYSPEPRATLR